MNLSETLVLIRKIFPNASLSVNHDDEIIINTGLTSNLEDDIIDMESLEPYKPPKDLAQIRQD